VREWGGRCWAFNQGWRLGEMEQLLGVCAFLLVSATK